MEIDQAEEENPRKSEVLRNLIGKRALQTSITKLSGSSRIIPSDTDFHFYNNFPEFKKPVKEIDEVSKNLLLQVGESESLFRSPLPLPIDEKIELDDDLANDWIENANDEIFEKFDASLDEFKGLRMKEEESGVRKMRVNLDDDSKDGFQTVSRRKDKKFLFLEDNGVEWEMKKVQEVKVAEKVKPSVPFHIHTIPRPQEEYKIFVNNSNQQFEHVWLERSDDGTAFLHPLEKLSVLDFVDKSDEIAEPVKPAPIELTPFTLVEELDQLKQLAAKLRDANEFAVDLEHNQYRSFQGLTCLMQISTRTEDFVIDTLKLRIYIGPHLRDVFKDPNKRKVMHGADRDILWLQRDFSIYVCNMFDTGQASRVLKLERKSLEYLLSHFCGVSANKEYQNADWRLRPLPNEMVRYAREDTHYLLYIYDVLMAKLRKASAESENSEPPLIEVYQRSYNICKQLYEKELLTSDSYLHIYGLQDAELNAEQLAVVSGLFEWRDIIARADDESTGYVLPNRTLLELAKQMPLTPRKLRFTLKSKHPYIERNLGYIVSIIKQSIQNANAFEKAADYLKERRLELTNEQNALATEESELLTSEDPETKKNTEPIEDTLHSNSPGNSVDATSIASVECKNVLTSTGPSNVEFSVNVLESAHYQKNKGSEKGGSDGCVANVQKEILLEPGHSIHTDVNLLQMAETTVHVQKKPSRAFGALFGNSAKRKYDPEKKEQEGHILEQIRSTVTLPFLDFLGKDELISQPYIESTTKIPEHSNCMEDNSAPATASSLEDVIVFGDDSDANELGKGNCSPVSDDHSKQQENSQAGFTSETEGDETMSVADLSSSFQKCFPSLQQTQTSQPDRSKLSQGFLQVEPFDYAAARKQLKFGKARGTCTPEENDKNNRPKPRRDWKKGSGVPQPHNDEDNSDFPLGRRRLAFPASGNRSSTFRR